MKQKKFPFVSLLFSNMVDSFFLSLREQWLKNNKQCLQHTYRFPSANVSSAGTVIIHSPPSPCHHLPFHLLFSPWAVFFYFICFVVRFLFVAFLSLSRSFHPRPPSSFQPSLFCTLYSLIHSLFFSVSSFNQELESRQHQFARLISSTSRKYVSAYDELSIESMID